MSLAGIFGKRNWQTGAFSCAGSIAMRAIVQMMPSFKTMMAASSAKRW
jgi:hypothetical protein